MNFKKTPLLLQYTLITAFVLFISIGHSMAQSRIEKIVKAGEIKIGMTGSQPPYSMKAVSGEIIGYDVDLAKALAESMNLKLNIVVLPFTELIPALKTGKVDAVLSGMSISPQRNMEVAFVGPYILSGTSILTKSSLLAGSDEANDLNQPTLKLVALKGSTSELFVKNYISGAILIQADDYTKGVEMVINNQADALVADYSVCVLAQLKYPNANLVSLDQPLTIEPIGMALPPGDALYLNLMQNFFNSLAIGGNLDEMEHYWFEDGSWLIDVEPEIIKQRLSSTPVQK